jgi:hypothetical protein
MYHTYVLSYLLGQIIDSKRPNPDLQSSLWHSKSRLQFSGFTRVSRSAFSTDSPAKHSHNVHNHDTIPVCMYVCTCTCTYVDWEYSKDTVPLNISYTWNIHHQHGGQNIYKLSWWWTFHTYTCQNMHTYTFTIFVTYIRYLLSHIYEWFIRRYNWVHVYWTFMVQHILITTHNVLQHALIATHNVPQDTLETSAVICHIWTTTPAYVCYIHTIRTQLAWTHTTYWYINIQWG